MPTISAKDVKALRDQTGAGMMDCKNALKDADGDREKAMELLRERGLARAGKRAGRATSEGAIAIAVAGANAGIVEVGCETDFVAKTDDFLGLASDIASLVASDAGIDSPESAMTGQLGGGSVEDRLKASVATLGENIELKRVTRLSAGTGVAGGYVHAGGKLGVIVALETKGSGDEIEALAKDLSMHVAAVDPTPLAVDRDGVDASLVEKERDLLRREAVQSGKPEKVVDKIVEGRIGKFYAEHCLLEQAFVKDPDQSVADVVKQVAGRAGSEVSVVGFTRFKLGEANES